MKEIVSEIQKYFENTYNSEERIEAYRNAYDGMLINENIDDVMDGLRAILKNTKSAYRKIKKQAAVKPSLLIKPSGDLGTIISENFDDTIVQLYKELPDYDTSEDLDPEQIAWFNAIFSFWKLKFSLPESFQKTSMLRYVWEYEFCEALLECFDLSGLHPLIYSSRHHSYNIKIDYNHTVDGFNSDYLKFLYCLERQTFFQNFLLPYKKGLPIYIDGVKINGQIRSIQVRQTMLNKEELPYYAESELRDFEADLNTTEFFNLFEDVTNDLISHTTMYEEQLNDGIWASLNSDVYNLVNDNIKVGNFSEAVRTAVIELNHRIKVKYRKIKGKELDGANLMRNAFRPENPTFKILDEDSETAKNFQEGYMNIFAGTIIAIRNPLAHENLMNEKQEAFEKLMLIGHLFKVFENSTEITAS